MLKISNIKIPASRGSIAIYPAAAKILNIPSENITNLKILRKSVDSRKKPEIFYIYTIAVDIKNEDKVFSKCRNKNVIKYRKKQYAFPFSGINTEHRPIIVGMGPAGIFAALSLAEAGIPCTILERGKQVEKRTADIAAFWEKGILNESSNVQFGEGGAGTFSDGKLTTGVNDERISYVFRRFIEFGAPEDIAYLAKPHIGTDNLKIIVKNIREYLISLGCDIKFEHKLEEIKVINGNLKSIRISHGCENYEMQTDCLILAIGNSARDTFRMLYDSNVAMSPKSFAVGVRIEHLQKNIDLAQYGEAATLGTLPASDYKLAVHLDSGRSVFTFCVCPGGSVVAASSEVGRVVTNGMSEYARDKKNINGGLLIGIDPSDFENKTLGGIKFQEFLEKSAFIGGGENYCAPAQLVSDFLKNKPSTEAKSVRPSYLPGVNFCNLWDVLPEFVCRALADALPMMDKKIHGFADGDAVLTAVETRSSSPVRIERDECFVSSISGIYPCGEGAGFAGGITSASVDGIKCAEKVCSRINQG